MIGSPSRTSCWVPRAAGPALGAHHRGSGVMLWVTWRQFRTEAITALCVLASLAVVLLYTAPHLLHLYHASGIATCQGPTATVADSSTTSHPTTGYCTASAH